MKEAKIALIKIDVEGRELQVLKGARSTFAKHMPAILFEQEASQIVAGSSEVVKFLEGLDYGFFTIKKNFYFGEGIFSKVVGLALRTLLGEQPDFVEINDFERKFII